MKTIPRIAVMAVLAAAFAAPPSALAARGTVDSQASTTSSAGHSGRQQAAKIIWGD